MPHPHLSVLTANQVQAIHEATLHILQEIGVILRQPDARKVLQEAGATIRDDRVCLPPELVEASLARCPHRVSIRGRNGRTAVLGDGTLHCHNLGGARAVYEPATGQRRSATIQDDRDSARLLDAMDNVTTIVPFFTPQDVRGELMVAAMYRNTVPFTTKPVQGPGVMTPAEVRCVVEMAAVIGPPSEVLTLSASPLSPLQIGDDVAAAIMEIARHKVAFGPLPCPIAGVSCPMSLAGGLAQQNAEILAAIILAQCVQPGLPVIYCGRLSMMEPRSGISVWGGIETALASAGTVQIAHRYNLPANVYGLCTDAHVLSMQNGYERALNAVVPALAGADELSGVGESEGGATSSFAQIVCDNEIISTVRHLQQGIATDKHALAVEVISEVMEGSRQYVDQPHTVEYLRKYERFIPQLAERRQWDEWDHTGRHGFVERAQEEAQRLLAEHEVEPLTDDQERALDDIMCAAERDLSPQGK